MIQNILLEYFKIEVNFQETFKLNTSLNWIIYNLPDLFWSFSLTSFLILSTRRDSRYIRLMYFSTGIVIMVTLEIFYGTFDGLDLFAMLIGLTLALITLRKYCRLQM